MKYLQLSIMFLFLLAAAGCGGDEPESTPFVIQDPATEPAAADSEEPAVDAPPPSETPEPAADVLEVPTETPTSTPTPTSTLEIATIPADETPLAPGIKATVDMNDPDIAATVGPLLTALPDLDLGDLDLDALPELPGGLELPGGIQLPDLPLPSLPGG